MNAWPDDRRGHSHSLECPWDLNKSSMASDAEFVMDTFSSALKSAGSPAVKDKACRPAEREMLGDDVPVGVVGELEDQMALAGQGADQPARQVRIVARYERGKRGFGIGFPIVGAGARVQQDQCRGAPPGRYLRCRDVIGRRPRCASTERCCAAARALVAPPTSVTSPVERTSVIWARS